ncbi:MAG TPA: hypothetical protein VK753_11670, partial [Xanthomonadaceae bacterium]|nr:hypothetical protein [Xanthomonadaceae bacterium]
MLVDDGIGHDLGHVRSFQLRCQLDLRDMGLDRDADEQRDEQRADAEGRGKPPADGLPGLERFHRPPPAAGARIARAGATGNGAEGSNAVRPASAG